MSGDARSGVVALHTQALREPTASEYLRLMARAVRAARLNKTFPERRELDGTLRALHADAHQGLYDTLYIDSRSGLPNMASLTRALTDKAVGEDSLGSMDEQTELDARREEADVFERLSRKRRYYEQLKRMVLAPVDEHRVLLRRHEPASSRASFRVELTKLSGSGTYLRVVIELTQTAGLWAYNLVKLDAHGEVAQGTEALRALVYRFATYDAETLFVRLHDLEGVLVERVQRGIVGPVLFSLPGNSDSVTLAEPHPNPLSTAWAQWLTSCPPRPQLVASFGTDVAAVDVSEERSNDPLSPLMSTGLQDKERARYRILRERHPFRVYKDRKFVTTPDCRGLVEALCSAVGTKNIIYPLR